MNPLVIEEKCIFHLRELKELTNLYKSPTINGNIQIQDNKYWAKDSNGAVNFEPKESITPNNKVFSISFFAKRDTIIENKWAMFGFYFNSSTLNLGYTDANQLYVDDKSINAYSSAIDVSSILNNRFTDIIFYTFCRDSDGRWYISLNGKQLSLVGETMPTFSDTHIDYITLYAAEHGYGISDGWLDDIIIHKEVCLYKTNFSCPPYPYWKNNIIKHNYLKLY